jgi:hypothetical protein
MDDIATTSFGKNAESVVGVSQQTPRTSVTEQLGLPPLPGPRNPWLFKRESVSLLMKELGLPRNPWLLKWPRFTREP